MSELLQSCPQADIRITAGAVKTTDEQKRQLATKAHTFNLNSKKFRVGPHTLSVD
jgi:hypothetical protein